MSFSIAFVGVGRMGANMARRLKDKGYRVTAVYDIHRETAENLAKELDCTAPSKLAEISTAADLIITVVTNDEAMQSIFFGQEDNLLSTAPGKIFLNCATVSPGVHATVERAAEAVGASALEGCMASSITQAREGTLYLMIGGKKEVFEQIQPVLADMSKSMRYVGTTGKAAQVKALVNMVMNINTAGLAEGLGLGEALGLDLDMLMEVFSQTGANSRVLETDGADMKNREHDCFFSAEHAAKDSGIANSLAREAGLNLPLSEATEIQYHRMVKKGLGHLDKSGIAELTFKNRAV